MNFKTLFIYLIIYLIATIELQAFTEAPQLLIRNPKLVYSTLDNIDFTISYNHILDDKIIRIKIVDSVNNVAASKMVIVKNNKFNGSIRIPNYLKSGIYVLISEDIINPNYFNFEPINIISPTTFDEQDISSQVKLFQYHPSSRPTNIKNNLSITGKVNSDNQPLQSQVVVLQSRGGTNKYAYTLTNESGMFTFYDSLWGLNELNFSLVNNSGNEYSISIENMPYETVNSADIVFKPYKLSSELNNSIDELKKIVIDYNDYGKIKPPPIIFKSIIAFDKNFVLEEYISMPTTLETIKELVPLKKIRSKKGRNYLYLLNDFNNSYFKSEPVYLIDGFIVDNFDEILQIDIKNIKSIHSSFKLNNRNLYLGPIAEHGIFAIITHNGNYIPQNGQYLQTIGIEKD